MLVGRIVRTLWVGQDGERRPQRHDVESKLSLFPHTRSPPTLVVADESATEKKKCLSDANLTSSLVTRVARHVDSRTFRILAMVFTSRR